MPFSSLSRFFLPKNDSLTNWRAVATFSLRRLSLSLDKLLDSNRPLLGPAPSLHRLTKAVGEDFVQKLGTWVAPYAKRDLPLHRLRQLSLLASNAHMLPSKNRPIIIVKGRTRKTFRRTVPRPVPSRIFKKALAGAMKQLQSQGTPVKKLTKPRLVRFRRYFEVGRWFFFFLRLYMYIDIIFCFWYF